MIVFRFRQSESIFRKIYQNIIFVALLLLFYTPCSFQAIKQQAVSVNLSCDTPDWSVYKFNKHCILNR